MWCRFSAKTRPFAVNSPPTKLVSFYFCHGLYRFIFRCAYMKFFILSSLLVTSLLFSITNSHASVVGENTPPQRIITLAPHLAEIVYALNKGSELIAVSEASNYPESVKSLPTVANYRGLNFTEILRAKPTHILAWQGGNQSKDIQKLQTMGLSVLAVNVHSLEDITQQIREVGTYINAQNTTAIANKF